jgi:hypothetical protein
MRLSVRLLLILLGTAAYFSLANLGWRGFVPFFAHSALLALALVTALLAIVSCFAGGNISSGVREDRSNRWVLAAVGFIGLLSGYLPAYTDRRDRRY